MKTASKLALLCALALAASAVASASALATTITPVGAYSATADGPVTISNSVITITCTQWTLMGTAQNTTTPSTMTIDTLTIGSCSTATGPCSMVSVTTLPAGLNVVHNPGGNPTANGTAAAATESFGFVCGGSSCTVSIDTTLALELRNSSAGEPGTIRVVNQQVNMSGGVLTCGTTATWNSAWTIDSIGAGTTFEVGA
jgi:predicted transglutaminase-like cysteine proteinase